MSGNPFILMVEPDVLVRQPIAEYLRECGYKVVETGNTDEALLVVNARTMTIDIVPRRRPSPGEIGRFWAGPLDERKPAKRQSDSGGNGGERGEGSRRSLRGWTFSLQAL